MEAVPAEMPVTSPEVAWTVATPVALLLQAPPVALLPRVVVKPTQTAVFPVIGPTSGKGFTVTTPSVELAALHTPLWITALYRVVMVRLLAVSEVVMLAMSVEVAHPSVEDCHLRMDPLWPDRVKVVLLFPAHTVADPDTVPPAETGSTVTVASPELTEEQMPL